MNVEYYEEIEIFCRVGPGRNLLIMVAEFPEEFSIREPKLQEIVPEEFTIINRVFRNS